MKFLNFLNPAHHVKKQICGEITSELYKELCNTPEPAYFEISNNAGATHIKVIALATRNTLNTQTLKDALKQRVKPEDLDILRSFVGDELDNIIANIPSIVHEKLGNKKLIVTRGKKRAILSLVEDDRITLKDFNIIDLLEGNA